MDEGEVCDEGDANSNEGTCSLACTLPSCGDGFLQADEECDDGNDVSQDACRACIFNVCGDAYLNIGVEECDNGVLGSKECDPDCTLPSCGDGVFNSDAEPCDDGNLSNTDACTNECMKKSCGDGYIQPGESCEDGNFSNGDGCSSNCVFEKITCRVNGDVILGITKSVAPSNRAALCVDHPNQGPHYKGPSYESMCPLGWHLCSGPEFNARNEDWMYVPAKDVLGVIRCKEPAPGAAQWIFKPTSMVKDVVQDNCNILSGKDMCGGGIYLGGESFTFALCCAPLATCGNGKVDSEEQCDDGNKLETDDCTNECAFSKCP